MGRINITRNFIEENWVSRTGEPRSKKHPRRDLIPSKHFHATKRNIGQTAELKVHQAFSFFPGVSFTPNISGGIRGTEMVKYMRFGGRHRTGFIYTPVKKIQGYRMLEEAGDDELIREIRSHKPVKVKLVGKVEFWFTKKGYFKWRWI